MKQTNMSYNSILSKTKKPKNPSFKYKFLQKAYLYIHMPTKSNFKFGRFIYIHILI